MNANSNAGILDVAIVGAGPTGLALAAALTQRNHRVAVFDRQAVKRALMRERRVVSSSWRCPRCE